MGNRNPDPNNRMIKVKLDLSRPDVSYSVNQPPNPERERIIQAVQVRILREAGHLPLKD